MFQVGDLIRDKAKRINRRVAFVTKVEGDRYLYYMLFNPGLELSISRIQANDLCELFQR